MPDAWVAGVKSMKCPVDKVLASQRCELMANGSGVMYTRMEANYQNRGLWIRAIFLFY
jgi:hypothetical protein